MKKPEMIEKIVDIITKHGIINKELLAEKILEECLSNGMLPPRLKSVLKIDEIVRDCLDKKTQVGNKLHQWD